MKSYTLQIKEEICNHIIDDKLDIIPLLVSFIRNNGVLSIDKIDLYSENMFVVKYLHILFTKNFNISINCYTELNKIFGKNHIYHLQIVDYVPILKKLEIIDSNNNLIPSTKDYLIADESQKASYLKGVFLACGSINDPKKSRYHLEFLMNRAEEAVIVQRILNEFDLNSRIIRKGIKYMVYVKEADKISDFLKLVGAYKAILYFENVRAYREQKNLTNRLNNMEQANVEKTFATALKQIEDIEYITMIEGSESFDKKLKEAIEYRLKYRESSLAELSKIMIADGIKITKSGLNHRFRKIKETADYLRRKQRRLNKDK